MGFKQTVLQIVKKITDFKSSVVWLSVLTFLLVLYDFGFSKPSVVNEILSIIYVLSISIAGLYLLSRYIDPHTRPRPKVWPIDIGFLIFIIFIILSIARDTEILFIQRHGWLQLAVILFFLREIVEIRVNIDTQYLNPARLFVVSFISIILFGTILIMLPNATHNGISLVDALFTSTSAVCVTGLIVVDTGTYFTKFGQSIIILLIQLGGIGIMTFTSYFSYFFRGSTSYKDQLLIKDVTQTEKISEVIRTLKRIILLTFSVEAIGGIIIFFSTDNKDFSNIADRLFFSLFHAISGFCNAGFSTLSSSFYDFDFRFNYPLHMTIAVLFIIGGLGFPIIFNFFKYFKYLAGRWIVAIGQREKATIKPWVININTRIVLITTLILIVSGTTLFYIFEFDNTLDEHHGFGKIVTAFFGAVTPRTAGFNTVDTSALNFSTIMIVFLLMWIGASPASTGGGIKTSAFAIATLNYLSLARGKDRLEVYGREIASISIRRAFAFITLSFVVIGISVFLIAGFDSDKDLLHIAFECFSAYSTVGLSLGQTGELSSASKLVIICTMFIGRVSMLTLLIALFRKVHHLKYRYPTEEILIN